MVVVKAGKTLFKSTIKRNSTAVAIERIDKFLAGTILERDLYRGYPMELFYEREVLFERVLQSESAAKEFERDYASWFSKTFQHNEDINGDSEVREVSEESLQEFIEYATQKYPTKPWAYGDMSVYIHRVQKRENPLPIPTKIQEHFRREYIP